MAPLSNPIHYKVSSADMIVGGICRDFDCVLPEHEHPEAQLTVIFSSTTPSLVKHDEAGRTRKSGLPQQSFLFMAPGQPHRLNWSDYGEVLHLWMKTDDLLELAQQSRCPLPVSQMGDHLDRGIYELGRMLIDEFDATGGLTPTLLNHATALMMARVLRLAERQARDTPQASSASRASSLPSIGYTTARSRSSRWQLLRHSATPASSTSRVPSRHVLAVRPSPINGNFASKRRRHCCSQQSSPSKQSRHS